jgi:hypothetical protein
MTTTAAKISPAQIAIVRSEWDKMKAFLGLPPDTDTNDIITVPCANRPIPGLEAYHEPKKWNVRVSRAKLERALASNGAICRLATYRPDGEKTLDMLSRLPSGLRDAWERKHGTGMIQLCFLTDKAGKHLTA